MPQCAIEYAETGSAYPITRCTKVYEPYSRNLQRPGKICGAA